MRWLFDLDLKEDGEEACLRKRVPGDGSVVLKGSLPQGPLAHAWSMEDPSIQGWVKTAEKESRDEAAQRGMEELYQRQCGRRWELFYYEHTVNA